MTLLSGRCSSTRVGKCWATRYRSTTAVLAVCLVCEHTNADSESYDRGIYTYSWTLDSDNKTPELVFEEDAFESDAHGPLGPAGGIVLSLIALLVAAHLRARNQSR